MTDLSAVEWSNLFERMKSDDALLQTYYMRFRGRSDVSCDAQCRAFLICGSTEVDPSQYTQCLRALGVILPRV